MPAEYLCLASPAPAVVVTLSDKTLGAEQIRYSTDWIEHRLYTKQAEAEVVLRWRLRLGLGLTLSYFFGWSGGWVEWGGVGWSGWRSCR